VAPTPHHLPQAIHRPHSPAGALSHVSGKIPVTIVTGFLGSGKTTLIRHLLQNPGGRRLAVLVNEFGTVGVDGEILKACADENCPESAILELANGCICCTVADDFIPTVEKLLALPQRPDHILIETSGLALPKPLLKAFDWPAIRSRITVDGVIALADAEAVAAGRFAPDVAAVDAQRAADDSLDHETPLSEVFEDQLACADIVLLTKADLVDAPTLDAARAVITAEAPRPLPMLPVTDGVIDPPSSSASMPPPRTIWPPAPATTMARTSMSMRISTAPSSPCPKSAIPKRWSPPCSVWPASRRSCA
jgi:cobalamin biosynthesis protein CobW